MKLLRQYSSLTRFVFTFALIVLAAGCGETTSSENSTSRIAKPGIVVQADTGDIVAVRVNENVILDGSASSTTSTGLLTYDWSFTAKPDTSNAVLQNATSVNPGFIADVAGTYTLQLVVSAGGISSQRAIASVEASVDGWFTGKRVHTRYPSQCDECHDGRFAEGDDPIDPILTKTGVHPATSNVCQACHTTFGFNLIRFIDHDEVFGDCSSCHDGVVATGKSVFHVVTSAECGSCHTTSSFLELGLDGSFDHSGITRACATCHNGNIAIGKHEGHLLTDTDCASCHTTVNFRDAYVDHSNITENCESCHNGSDAKGQIVDHPVMAVDCGICHNTTRFSLDGVFNHRIEPAVQPCSTCHNGNNSINALGQPLQNHPNPDNADCGVCHNTNNFADAFVDHTDPLVVGNSCDSCHGVTALGKSVNHIPTTEDCAVCHTPGTFTTGTYDHIGVVSGCTSCHNGIITAGKNANHIVTNPDDQDCVDCHDNTVNFAGAIFAHVGIDNSNCASCHNGDISIGKNALHLPTTRDCSDCHAITKFDNFTGATFDHVGIAANSCSSCHDGVIAIGKKINHIPSLVECSQCHVDTNNGGFASSIFMSDVHTAISGGCEGCHVEQFFPSLSTVVKAVNHLPTNQDCHVCHENTAFKPSIFSHTGITAQCETCHDGSADNVAVGAQGKSLNHPVTTEDCGVCHGVGANFGDGIFDHTGRVDNCDECHADNATGAVTKKHTGHVPTTQDCSICHVPGTFATAVFSHEGIVDNCASCHAGTAAIATIKSTNHLPTTEDCSVCHNPVDFAGARFDHQGIINNCTTCHDGNVATGKGGNHVPTSNDCSVCHLTTGFIPGSFDHSGIVDNCQSCHDGALATGKIVNHVETIQDCGVCHRVPANGSGFIPATFDHSTVSNNTRCDSCHGVTSAGKSLDHLATSLDCRSCHTTATFVGGLWVHDDSTTGTCKSCHSAGSGATLQPLQDHIATDLQCDVCHTTNNWAPTSFSHDPQGNYPGDHRRATACSVCHGNIVTTPFDYPTSQYQPFCAACHAGDFERKGRHIGGENGTVEQNKDCSGGGTGCHRVNDSEF